MEYVKKFKAEQINFPHCSDNMTMSAFMAGLRHKDLFFSLGKKHVSTFNKVLKRAQRYVLAEELWLSSDQKFVKSDDMPKLTSKFRERSNTYQAQDHRRDLGTNRAK